MVIARAHMPKIFVVSPNSISTAVSTLLEGIVWFFSTPIGIQLSTNRCGLKQQSVHLNSIVSHHYFRRLLDAGVTGKRSVASLTVSSQLVPSRRRFSNASSQKKVCNLLLTTKSKSILSARKSCATCFNFDQAHRRIPTTNCDAIDVKSYKTVLKWKL